MQQLRVGECSTGAPQERCCIQPHWLAIAQRAADGLTRSDAHRGMWGGEPLGGYNWPGAEAGLNLDVMMTGHVAECSMLAKQLLKRLIIYQQPALYFWQLHNSHVQLHCALAQSPGPVNCWMYVSLHTCWRMCMNQVCAISFP